MSVRIGTSGWVYPHWRGRFYPADLSTSRWLRYAAERLDALEINTTFYGTARPATFERWGAQVDDRAAQGFRFALKGSRFLTHVKRLHDPQAPLRHFFASGPEGLGQALGPVLWQLPPHFRFEVRVVEEFLDALRRWPVRYAIEARDESFDCEPFHRLCELYDVAIVQVDPQARPVGSRGMAYARLHGTAYRRYAGRYTDQALADWAGWIRRAGRRGADEVYVFFNNDAQAHAPRDALRLIEYVRGLAPRRPAHPERHGTRPRRAPVDLPRRRGRSTAARR